MACAVLITGSGHCRPLQSRTCVTVSAITSPFLGACAPAHLARPWPFDGSLAYEATADRARPTRLTTRRRGRTASVTWGSRVAKTKRWRHHTSTSPTRTRWNPSDGSLAPGNATACLSTSPSKSRVSSTVRACSPMRHKRSATPGSSSTFTVGLSFVSSASSRPVVTELCGEPRRPFLDRGAHEVAKGRQRGVDDRVVNRLPDPAPPDHPGTQQAREVLGDVGPRQPGGPGQSHDRLFALLEQRVQDPQPGGIGEEGEPASDFLDHLIGDRHPSSYAFSNVPSRCQVPVKLLNGPPTIWLVQSRVNFLVALS